MISFVAVGDVGAKRADPFEILAETAHVIASGDVRFGQLEAVITDRGAMSPNARLAMRTGSDFAPALDRAGFNVMSFAGNHTLDWGYEGLTDTLDAMRKTRVALCGAGENIAAARKPAIVETRDGPVAILAYNSILPEGYVASKSRGGCAPLRAHTIYSQIEPDQPGTDARTLSFCYPEDLSAMKADIAAAKEIAETVIVSMHWGVHMKEAVIAHYQREAAYAAIDAGAAAIIGHHAHILKGVEFYRGAPIFYSLGNFALEQPHVWDPAIVETESYRHLLSLNSGGKGAGGYVLPYDTRYTGVVRLAIDAGRVMKTEFLPAFIGDDTVPRMVGQKDDKFGEVQRYLERISRAERFATQFSPVGDALVLSV